MIHAEIARKLDVVVQNDHAIHAHWLRDVLPKVLCSLVADYVTPLWIVRAKEFALLSEESAIC